MEPAAMKIYDTVAGSLVPMVVIVHALSPVVAPSPWAITRLEGVGDLSALHSDGIAGLENAAATHRLRAVRWTWIEQLAVLLDDLQWLEMKGTDIKGVSLRVTCIDSTYWEIFGSDMVEQRTHSVFVRAV